MIRNNNKTYSHILYCLPYAGGSEVIYSNWNGQLSKNIEIKPILLPGHGAKYSEKLIDTMSQLVEKLFENIDTSSSYSIFGHSMGGMIAYELAAYIEQKGINPPENLFISGCSLNISGNKTNYYKKTDYELMNHLVDINEDTKKVFQNTKLKDFYLPILKNDYKLVETYRFNAYELSTKIYLFACKNDTVIDYQDIKKLKSKINISGIYFFDGGHFFINSNTKNICETIMKLI